MNPSVELCKPGITVSDPKNPRVVYQGIQTKPVAKSLIVKNLLFFQRVGWRKRLPSGFEHSELRTDIVAGRPGEPEFPDAKQNNRGGQHKPRRHDRGELARDLL